MSSHTQMKWDASQGKWTEIGPDHPNGLPYEPSQAAEDSLYLQIGDQIVWQDTEIKTEDMIVSPGMKGQVISHVIGGGCTVPARALVQFESGASLLVDQWHKWEKVTEG